MWIRIWIGQWTGCIHLQIGCRWMRIDSRVWSWMWLRLLRWIWIMWIDVQGIRINLRLILRWVVIRIRCWMMWIKMNS